MRMFSDEEEKEFIRGSCMVSVVLKSKIANTTTNIEDSMDEVV